MRRRPAAGRTGLAARTSLAHWAVRLPRCIPRDNLDSRQPPPWVRSAQCPVGSRKLPDLNKVGMCRHWRPDLASHRIRVPLGSLFARSGSSGVICTQSILPCSTHSHCWLNPTSTCSWMTVAFASCFPAFPWPDSSLTRPIPIPRTLSSWPLQSSCVFPPSPLPQLSKSLPTPQELSTHSQTLTHT